MSDYIDYYSHKLSEPAYYQRNYERDLPQEENEEAGWLATGKRITLLAVPFLSLHKPFGLAISLSMGTARCVTHLSMAIQAAGDSRHGEAVHQVTQLAWAVMALAGSVFNMTIGLLATTGQECALSAYGSLQHLLRGDYEKAAEDLIQGTSSALYLAIMVTGSLEITCTSMVVQALLCLYQARHELAEGRHPEAAAKIVMGLIRCRQAENTYQMIARKNHLIAINRQFEQLLARAKNGKEIDHLFDSPLNDLDATILENRVTLSDAKDNEYDFGSHVHGFGKETVKGANLSFRTTVIDGKEVTELDFKVNHVFRDRIGTLIGDLQSIKKDDLQLLLAASNSHASDVKITKVPFEISKTLNISDAYKITFEGMGSVYVGASKSLPNLYDRVIVRMDKQKNIYHLHEMLSFLKLDDAIRESSQDDLLRLKIGHLFRTFCPREATPFERTEAFFNLPIDQLQQEIIKKAPAMKGLFEEHLAHMRPHEILPGKIRYGITGLADKAHELGARALTAAVTGAYTDAELFTRIGSMIKMGMISSEMRYTNQIAVSGMSSSTDFYTGGADSVFVQMLTEKSCRDHMPFSALNYHSKVRLLISLDVLETGTYQYPYDRFGTRGGMFGQYYPGRPGTTEFVSGLNTYMNPGHEVMIKERIPPSMFQGLIVDNTTTRDSLLESLRKSHIVQKGNDNIERILGIEVNQFIRVGKNVSEKLIGLYTARR